ncbi:SOS response-associated protein YedK [Methylococcales bacterium]|nr:SOS response-associated protein YedK [Methylococcales bacterium]
MCGRFVLDSPPELIAESFGLDDVPALTPRYNIAPSQDIPVIRAPAGVRECVLTRWGLVPAWSKEPRTEYSTINARAETVSTKPAFRDAFRRRRCLVVADGFFEWARAEGKAKTPYFIRLKAPGPFAFAGLWERWEKDGQTLETSSILVTEANDLMRPLHDRMPVILARDDYGLWLDPGICDPARLQPLLKPYPTEQMQAYPVSTAVNSVRNDGESLIRPLPSSTAATQIELF